MSSVPRYRQRGRKLSRCSLSGELVREPEKNMHERETCPARKSGLPLTYNGISLAVSDFPLQLCVWHMTKAPFRIFRLSSLSIGCPIFRYFVSRPIGFLTKENVRHRLRNRSSDRVIYAIIIDSGVLGREINIRARCESTGEFLGAFIVINSGIRVPAATEDIFASFVVTRYYEKHLSGP